MFGMPTQQFEAQFNCVRLKDQSVLYLQLKKKEHFNLKTNEIEKIKGSDKG
jgi:hypothetical protein